MAAILAIAIFLRFWQLAAVGFNSDEAVYTGAASSIAGDSALQPLFPVFRAHPLLFQTLLSLVLRVHDTDWTARAFSATIGVATVALTFLLGRRLYGRLAGLIAGLLLAVMPYHVIVSRQVLLDGLMTMCATIVLYCVVRYVESGRAAWLLAGGSAMGAAVLSKETSIVLLGALYAFFVLTPSARMRARHLPLASLPLIAEVVIWPLMLQVAGRTGTGHSYFLWQIFRRPNHGTWFYFTALPSWIGPAVLAAALAACSGCAAKRLGGNGFCLPGSSSPFSSSPCGRSRASSTCCPSPRRWPSWPAGPWPTPARSAAGCARQAGWPFPHRPLAPGGFRG